MKTIILNLLPFNNRTEMSKLEYVIKKILAFVLIYFMSAVLGEAVIIGLLSAMGYDPLHGDVPGGEASLLSQFVMNLFSLFGFAIFILVTLLYCRIIEKRSAKEIFGKKPLDYLTGSLIAVTLLAVIVSFCLVTGSMTFEGLGTNIQLPMLLLLLVGYMLQSAAEEVMCRGFLMGALKGKVPTWLAVLVSSTAFAFPHLPSIMEMESKYIVVAILNLYLVAILFSLLVLRRGNLWIACGLHFAWNYVLGGIMGLTVSGGDGAAFGLFLFKVENGTLLNGGTYGIEASVITTVVLGMVLAVMLLLMHKKSQKNVA
ncbi:MAG: CPBP family intramembrane metalloprotease [Lachnospiraceae bacterium]|nr:CPBP family intramembrane metalloprotease [Lachnospiraceae bacterium]